MQRLGQPDQPATADAFKLELEDRIQCLESGRLSYKRSLTNVLAMDIPVDAATNKDELEDFQVYKEWVSFATLLKLYYSLKQDSGCSTVKLHSVHASFAARSDKLLQSDSLAPASGQQRTMCWKHRDILCRSGRQSEQS